jgi:GH24 family phage-related lysozyme (muramidase)
MYSEGNPVPITQAQFDALVSFGFNAGAGRLITVLNRTVRPNHGREDGGFDMELFSHILLTQFTSATEPGLYARREAEINLFVYGIYP